METFRILIIDDPSYIATHKDFSSPIKLPFKCILKASTLSLCGGTVFYRGREGDSLFLFSLVIRRCTMHFATSTVPENYI